MEESAVSPHTSTNAITITDGEVSRSLTVSEGAMRSTSLTGAGAVLAPGQLSDEFNLTLSWEMVPLKRGLTSPVTLSASDFVVVESPSAGFAGSEASFTFHHAPLGVTVTIDYGVDPDTAVLTKSVAITASGTEPLRVERVVAEPIELPGEIVSKSGYGQPLQAEGWWAGIKHPGAFTAWNGSGAEIGIDEFGTILPGEELRLPDVVWGFAGRDGAKESFFAYVDAIRARPVARCISINTWYDLQRDDMNQALIEDHVAKFDQVMRVERGLSPDLLVIDDHWDDRNSGWQIDSQKFPGGFGAVQSAFEKTGMRMGLWFGPVGGYQEERTERVAWYGANGYEVSQNGEYLCLAGLRYAKIFARQLTEKLVAHDFGYLKLDGMAFNCLNPEHGHQTGAASRWTMIEALLDVLRLVRVHSPETFLSITTGVWLSPWWLIWADAVFIGGEVFGWDQGIPTIEPRDAATTYRDGVIYDDFIANTDVFPMSSLMSVGVIKGKLLRLGGEHESREAWRHDLVMEISRGIMQTELYLSPDTLSEIEWDDLCAALKWAKDHDDLLLAGTEMILGDPRRAEAYGYAHRNETAAIVTVRNPSIYPQRIPLDLSLWAPRGTAGASWREIYPGDRPVADHDGQFVLEVGPNEVVMLLAGTRDTSAMQTTTTRSRAATPPSVTVERDAASGALRIDVDSDDRHTGTGVIIAENLAADVTAAWGDDLAPSEQTSNDGTGWSVPRRPLVGGRASAQTSVSDATLSAWLWSEVSLNAGTAEGLPFVTQDYRVDAVPLWSGRLIDGILHEDSSSSIADSTEGR